MRYFVFAVLACVLGGCGQNRWATSFMRPGDATTASTLDPKSPVRVVKVPPHAEHRDFVGNKTANLQYLGESQFYLEGELDFTDNDVVDFAHIIGADIVGLSSTLDGTHENTYSVLATYWHTPGVK